MNNSLTIKGRFSTIQNAQLADALYVCIDELVCDIVQIDIRKASQQSETLSILAQYAHFPDYFGHNLDALYDILSEYIENESNHHQTWLIRSTSAQEKMLFPILDTIRDAMSESHSNALTILWWVNG